MKWIFVLSGVVLSALFIISEVRTDSAMKTVYCFEENIDGSYYSFSCN